MSRALREGMRIRVIRGDRKKMGQDATHSSIMFCGGNVPVGTMGTTYVGKHGMICVNFDGITPKGEWVFGLGFPYQALSDQFEIIDTVKE